MTRRILQSALLSLGVSLTGCVAYDFDQPGYAYSRYSGYGYQQPVYQTVHYREYPVQQTYRYPVRMTPVYVYRQPVVDYRRAAPWQGNTPRYWPADSGYRESRYREYSEHYNGHDRYQRHDRDDDDGHEQHRGWGERRY